MPTFSVSNVDAMSYDFEGFGQPGVKGIIPEPSSEQIETFLEVLRQVMPVTADADGTAKLDVAKVAEFFEGREDEAEDLINEAIATVCSDTPTSEQIAALPYRAKQAFYGFVVGSLLAPEA